MLLRIELGFHMTTLSLTAEAPLRCAASHPRR